MLDFQFNVIRHFDLSLISLEARIKYHLYCISRKRKKTKKDQLGTIFSTSKNVGEI